MCEIAAHDLNFLLSWAAICWLFLDLSSCGLVPGVRKCDSEYLSQQR